MVATNAGKGVDVITKVISDVTAHKSQTKEHILATPEVNIIILISMGLPKACLIIVSVKNFNVPLINLS